MESVDTKPHRDFSPINKPRPDAKWKAHPEEFRKSKEAHDSPLRSRPVPSPLPSAGTRCRILLPLPVHMTPVIADPRRCSLFSRIQNSREHHAIGLTRKPSLSISICGSSQAIKSSTGRIDFTSSTQFLPPGSQLHTRTAKLSADPTCQTLIGGPACQRNNQHDSSSSISLMSASIDH